MCSLSFPACSLLVVPTVSKSSLGSGASSDQAPHLWTLPQVYSNISELSCLVCSSELLQSSLPVIVSEKNISHPAQQDFSFFFSSDGENCKNNWSEHFLIKFYFKARLGSVFICLLHAELLILTPVKTPHLSFSSDSHINITPSWLISLNMVICLLPRPAWASSNSSDEFSVVSTFMLPGMHRN